MGTPGGPPGGQRIPVDALRPETLRAVIEEFVSREGTDYGDVEVSFEEKVDGVRNQLKRGVAVIVYDDESESCTIMMAEELRRRGL